MQIMFKPQFLSDISDLKEHGLDMQSIILRHSTKIPGIYKEIQFKSNNCLLRFAGWTNININDFGLVCRE